MVAVGVLSMVLSDSQIVRFCKTMKVLGRTIYTTLYCLLTVQILCMLYRMNYHVASKINEVVVVTR